MDTTTKTGKKVILVIEDEPSLLAAIKAKLLKNNFKVVSCSDVQTALRLLNDLPRVDLIWLDHYLIGDETGLDLIIKIKADPQKNRIPIFVVSVSTDNAKSIKYLQLGAEKFYTKSNFGLQDIINDIISYFKKNNL